MRVLCCLLLLWSVLLSGCGESKEDAAVVAIKDLGGAVGFEKTISGKPVVSVYFTDTDVTDAGLAHLKGLTSLQSLDLGGTQVTDVGLEHLKAMTGLQFLSLVGAHVTTSGVKDIQAALPKCKISK